ncbi:MAG: hypothetical protein HOP29_13670 [Phycisphaerales bacterium]|nr:hypothetical protein [Phycisphaerales bacterium]
MHSVRTFLAGVFCAFNVVSAAAADPQDETPGRSVVDVEAVLDRVEARGRTVNDLKCRVIYTMEDRVTADVTRREGEILFKRETPNPRFFISFDKTIQDGIASPSRYWYLFDGRWFHEANQKTKSIIKRDIAPPGTEIDLFSIDNAPFPIPFGQRKDQILKHFEVSPGDGAAGAPPDTDHLICIPRESSRLAAQYSRMEFFVSRTVDLPVRTVMVSRDGASVTRADFPDLSADSINRGLDELSFRLPLETSGYAVSVEK